MGMESLSAISGMRSNGLADVKSRDMHLDCESRHLDLVKAAHALPPRSEHSQLRRSVGRVMVQRFVLP